MADRGLRLQACRSHGAGGCSAAPTPDASNTLSWNVPLGASGCPSSTRPSFTSRWRSDHFQMMVSIAAIAQEFGGRESNVSLGQSEIGDGLASTFALVAGVAARPAALSVTNSNGPGLAASRAPDSSCGNLDQRRRRTQGSAAFRSGQTGRPWPGSSTSTPSVHFVGAAFARLSGIVGGDLQVYC